MDSIFSKWKWLCFESIFHKNRQYLHIHLLYYFFTENLLAGCVGYIFYHLHGQFEVPRCWSIQFSSQHRNVQEEIWSSIYCEVRKATWWTDIHVMSWLRKREVFVTFPEWISPFWKKYIVMSTVSYGFSLNKPLSIFKWARSRKR